MCLLIKLFLVLLLLLAGYGSLGAFWRRRYSFEPGYGEVHYVSTDDGWRIALFRYAAEGEKHPTPVLACHGLGANRFNFDLGEERSLARYLQRRGYEVWVLELRGRGESRRAKKGGHDYFHPYVVDDYVRRDASAAIAHVKKKTGAERIHWIGHSMGGLILLALLESQEANHIASGTAVASPGRFAPFRKTPLFYFFFRSLRYLPRVHQAFLAAGFAPLWVLLPHSLVRLVLNPRNTESLIVKRALCHLVSDMSRGEVLQFSDCIRHGEFRTYDGTFSYEANLGTVQKPLLLMAGTADFLCSPKSMQGIHDRVSSEKKRLVVLGKSGGQQEDYGHGDLLVGRHCEEEVYPKIIEWLEENEPAPQT